MKEYGLLIVGWAFYLSMHSLLAANGVKQKAQALVSKKVYRFVYSLFSLVGLLVLFMYAGTLDQAVLYQQHQGLRYGGLVLTTYGVIIIRLAFKQYSLKEFVGLGEQQTEQPLQTSGILSRVRHPLYSGTILLLIGYVLFSPKITTLVSVCCILTYLPIGIWLEERKLIAQYGDAYRQYKARVPMLIPRFGKDAR